ncbi:MAG: YciI family protein [Nevskiaceae bacterium]|nr:MAG: YciI family protein [Nevskiaceae bacterium]TAM22687.1 MAG: YciI family protein [Nevskiaceae bacterium]
MRYLILRRADARTEAGFAPTPEFLAAMGRYRAALERAGVYVYGDGLHASSRGAARLRIDNGEWTVVDGPFAETKELIAGFLIVECDSLAKAIRWAKACPSMAGDGVAEMEVRQIISAADLPAELAPYLANLPWNSVADAAMVAREPEHVCA